MAEPPGDGGSIVLGVVTLLALLLPVAWMLARGGS
jgi:hypothetical protein